MVYKKNKLQYHSHIGKIILRIGLGRVDGTSGSPTHVIPMTHFCYMLDL